MRTVEFRSRTSASAEALFALYADPDGLSKLTDPADGVVLSRSEGAMREGFEVTVAVPVGPLRARWTSVITAWDPPRSFTDEALRSPFALWRHRHGVEAATDGAWLVDRVDYALPMGPLGELVAGWFVRAKFDDLFRRRHRKHAAMAGGRVVEGHGA